MDYTLSLSSYQITWIEFEPEFGIATKADIAKIEGTKHLGKVALNGNYYRHFGTKERAINFLKNFDKKLSKKYTCRLFTDKQFGMRKASDNYKVPFTEKQLNETFVI